MVFHTINYAYFATLIFVAAIYLIAWFADKGLYYKSQNLKTIKPFAIFLFRHNKKSQNRIALITFIVQLISFIYVLVAISLIVTSLFLSESYAKWFLGIYSAVAFIGMLSVLFMYSRYFKKQKYPKAQDDPEYVEPEKTMFGRDELNQHPEKEQNEKTKN